VHETFTQARSPCCGLKLGPNAPEVSPTECQPNLLDLADSTLHTSCWPAAAGPASPVPGFNRAHGGPPSLHQMRGARVPAKTFYEVAGSRRLQFATLPLHAVNTLEKLCNCLETTRPRRSSLERSHAAEGPWRRSADAGTEAS